MLRNLWLLLFTLTGTFAFEDYNYYEETELEDIICSSNEECPSKQPLCKDNHCQFECDSIADCEGYPCIDGKCSRKSEFTRTAISHASEDDLGYDGDYSLYSDEIEPVGDRVEDLADEDNLQGTLAQRELFYLRFLGCETVRFDFVRILS